MMAPTSTMVRAVQEAVRRVPGSYVAPCIEAAALPGMGIGIVAKERVPKDSLIFQASHDAWYPFSAEFALREAQKKAPGFIRQLDSLFQSSSAFRDSSSFVPNALILGTHLAMSIGSELPAEGASLLTECYLPSLPEHVDLPFYWDETQFEALDGCHEVRQSIKQSAQFYFQLHQHLFGSENALVTPERFFWSISVLMSRATSGKSQPFTLIPFFDWFNHNDQGDECIQAFDSRKGFQIHTTREYEAGEQLFINYGAHGNTRLLRNYGFSTPSNPHDTVALSLPAELQQLDPNDTDFQNKAVILNALGATTKAKTLTFSSSGELSTESHQWLQLRLADSREMQSLIYQASSQPESSDELKIELPVSLEAKIQHHVQALCGARLKQHRHSIKSDEDFLAAHEGQMAAWLRGAMHVRLSEKLILTKAVGSNKK